MQSEELSGGKLIDINEKSSCDGKENDVQEKVMSSKPSH